MRIVHISYSDGRAGAYAAAYRLHRALRAAGVDSHMLVAQATRGDPHVHRATTPVGRFWLRAGLPLDQLPARLYPRRARGAGFSAGWLGGGLARRVAPLAPDLVHLHWAHGMVGVGDLPRLGSAAGAEVRRGELQRARRGATLQRNAPVRPIVWTLHDMWAFSGGCHYSAGCQRFVEGCGACPQLGSAAWADLSRLTWARKARVWAGLALALVAPSRWMAEQAARSALLGSRPAAVIANGLDLDVFRPTDRAAARARLGLPPGRRILLFGGMRADDDPRKGFDLLGAALGRLVAAGAAGEIDLATFGAARAVALAGLPLHALGQIDDDATLALAYAAADLFVAPSREDNLPNTVAEAMACGAPCAGFAVGGLPELIAHERSGYLARPLDVADLARGIAWALEDGPRQAALAAEARRRAEALLDAGQQAGKYLALYQRLIAASR